MSSHPLLALSLENCASWSMLSFFLLTIAAVFHFLSSSLSFHFFLLLFLRRWNYESLWLTIKRQMVRELVVIFVLSNYGLLYFSMSLRVIVRLLSIYITRLCLLFLCWYIGACLLEAQELLTTVSIWLADQVVRFALNRFLVV